MSWSDLAKIGSYLGWNRASPQDRMHQQAKRHMQQHQGRTVVHIPKTETAQAPPVQQKPSEPLSLTAKVTATAGTILTVTSAGSAVKDMVSSISHHLPTEALKSTANATSQAAQGAKDFVVDGSSDLISWAKWGASWGSWGASFLSPGAKLLLALGGGWLVYAAFFRSNRSGCSTTHNSTTHINLHGIDPQKCKVVKSEQHGPNGRETKVDIDCRDSQPQAHPVQNSPAAAAPKPASGVLTRAKILEKTKQIETIAKSLHDELKFYQTKRASLLPDALNGYIGEVVESYDELKPKKYRDSRIFSLIHKSGPLMTVIQAELDARKEEIEKLQAYEKKTDTKRLTKKREQFQQELEETKKRLQEIEEKKNQTSSAAS